MCQSTFSEATHQLLYRQRKRHLHRRIQDCLVSGVSLRRTAILLKLSRTTVARKFKLLAFFARIKNEKDFSHRPIVYEFQFDDLETFEHSKCKPLSVIMAVEKRTRKILGFQVARMPAKGRIAEKARKRYGFRRDERSGTRQKLFEEIRSKIHPFATIESDQNPYYKRPVEKFFSNAVHMTTAGRKGCVVGQGELKAGKFDPLFSLNHTFAMLRANINRLFRRTWCTTKDPLRLRDHLDLYVLYHNQKLT